MTTYVIVQWTPFPGEYQPIAEWQLQEAEFDLRLNKTHYYEHATRNGNDLTYSKKIAEQIVSYWLKRYSFAKYQIIKSECE